MPGGGYFKRFTERNCEYNNADFRHYVASHNRACLTEDALDDLAKHEVLRLAAEYEERRWRHRSVYGDPTE